MNPRDAAKWESRRAKGKNHFVSRYGVLGWGLGFAAVFNALQYWTGLSRRFFPDALIVLVLALVGGYAWGQFMWYWMERLYSKTSSKG